VSFRVAEASFSGLIPPPSAVSRDFAVVFFFLAVIAKTRQCQIFREEIVGALLTECGIKEEFQIAYLPQISVWATDGIIR
jgi:hypothetical protein